METKPAQIKILFRLLYRANTDPQRRCYDGHHFSSELRWTDWSELETIPADRVERRLAFWQELNDYAVKERGPEGTRREYRLVPECA